MEAVAARNSQPHALAAHRSTLPLAAASREAVEAVQHQIQQQRKIIDRCKSENHTLREELQSRTKLDPYVPSPYEQDKLAQLTDLIDVFTRKVAGEEQQVESLQAQIRQCKDQALQTRAQMGGINAAKQAVRNHALNASQMQSRLDRALLHYHSFLTRNKTLQSEIQELRWERSGFDMAHGKLSEQLQIISAEANAVAASTEVAHAAERHATAEAELLRAQGDAEQVAFDNQMHELKLLMAADEKLWQLRGSVVSIAAEAAAMQGPQGDANSPISLQEPEWTTQQEAEAEEHFERMQQASGMGNKLELVDAYVTAEAANFELFNQVAGINAQAAELQDLIVQQQATVGRLRRKGDQSDPDWLVQLELSRRVSAAHRAAEQCLVKANNAMRTLEEVLKALTHMVYVLPTAGQGDEQDDHETCAVTEDNLTERLASIEQRSMGILVQYSSLPSSERDSPRIATFNIVLDDADGALTRFRMHLNGFNTQHGKSHSVVASQGTSRASTPGPDNEHTLKETTSSTEGTVMLTAAASRLASSQDG
ncbi:Outer dynein arm protein 1 [Trebouxia sp. C0009 RCD-2024]